MAITVNTNVASLNAQRNLSKSGSTLTKSLERLSSGLRINSAKDDAAGLAIATRMNAQVRGLNQAARNANDGISMAQTAEGALQESGNILQRIRELAIQSANDSNSASDRGALNAEVQQLLAEAQRISVTTQFNGKNIIDGSLTGAQFHVGAYANQTIGVNVGNAQNAALGSYQVSGATAVGSSALAAGDLLINGTDVGVSTSSSAESKTAAINAASNLTGVTATASTTVTSSTANPLVRNVTLQAGDLVINGVNIGSVAGSNNVVTQGANLATAINAVSNQTGVQAVASQSTGALTLTSSTGKDIAITSGSAAGATRLEQASGLEVSDLSGATASTSTTTFTGTLATNAFVASAAAAANSFDGNIFTVGGVNFEFDSTNGGATGDQLGSGNYLIKLAGASADTVVATAIRTAISAAKTNGESGLAHTTLTAAATNTVTLTADVMTTDITTLVSGTGLGAGLGVESQVNVLGQGAAVGDTLNVGGVTYEFGYSGTTPASGNVLVAFGATVTASALNLANAVTAQHTAGNTNITATSALGVATLVSDAVGSVTSNVAITEPISTGTAGSVVGALTVTGLDGTNVGQTGRGIIELNSAENYLITGNNVASAGLASATVGLTTIEGVDISTAEGANTAIALMDGALSQVTSIRGDLGAVQNRFESTIANLASTSENISAAQARIMDADFAVETANMTKAQILQQAGLAMLSQANQIPQAALTLLK
ncbi:MAG: flagellin [Desulfurivibrionaceae bacterium]|nr:flagellin [Desulfurivibrionaceae bacterium]